MTEDIFKEKTIYLDDIKLPELLITIGGSLFAGADLNEIETALLIKLRKLINYEIRIRRPNTASLH